MIIVWLIESFQWFCRLWIPPPPHLRRRVPIHGRCPVCGNKTDFQLRFVRHQEGAFVQSTCGVCYTAWLEEPVSAPKLPVT